MPRRVDVLYPIDHLGTAHPASQLASHLTSKAERFPGRRSLVPRRIAACTMCFRPRFRPHFRPRHIVFHRKTAVSLPATSDHRTLSRRGLFVHLHQVFRTHFRTHFRTRHTVFHRGNADLFPDTSEHRALSREGDVVSAACSPKRSERAENGPLPFSQVQRCQSKAFYWDLRKPFEKREHLRAKTSTNVEFCRIRRAEIFENVSTFVYIAKSRFLPQVYAGK